MIYLSRDGIFDGPCEGSVAHNVNVVGYGKSEKSGIDYWVGSVFKNQSNLYYLSLIF